MISPRRRAHSRNNGSSSRPRAVPRAPGPTDYRTQMSRPGALALRLRPPLRVQRTVTVTVPPVTDSNARARRYVATKLSASAAAARPAIITVAARQEWRYRPPAHPAPDTDAVTVTVCAQTVGGGRRRPGGPPGRPWRRRAAAGGSAEIQSLPCQNMAPLSLACRGGTGQDSDSNFHPSPRKQI
jgi:hypothetical protein